MDTVLKDVMGHGDAALLIRTLLIRNSPFPLGLPYDPRYIVLL